MLKSSVHAIFIFLSCYVLVFPARRGCLEHVKELYSSSFEEFRPCTPLWGRGHSTPLKPPRGPKKLNRFFRKKFSTLMPANDLLAFNLGNSLICFQILANIIRRHGNLKLKNHVKHYDVIFRVNNQKLFTINNIELSEKMKKKKMSANFFR